MPDQRPAGMSLAADVGLRRIILRIQRVEVLVQAGLGGDPGIDGAAHLLSSCRSHGLVFTAALSRRPKKRGPFHLLPVIAKAILDRLSLAFPFQTRPASATMIRWH